MHATKNKPNKTWGINAINSTPGQSQASNIAAINNPTPTANSGRGGFNSGRGGFNSGRGGSNSGRGGFNSGRGGSNSGRGGFNSGRGGLNSNAARPPAQQQPKQQQTTPKTTPVVNQTQGTSSQWLCADCGGTTYHKLDTCPSFQKKNVNERSKIVKLMNLCMLCLGRGHIGANCRSQSQCGTCSGRHNTLLHQNRPQQSATKGQS